jgi:F-type H+-transporting ATPase subunit delta
VLIPRSVVRRYMQAAHQAAREPGAADRVGAQLERLQSVVAAAPELMRLLKHPKMTMARKLRAATDLLGEELDPTAGELLKSLVQNSRQEALRVAGEVYREVADEAQGIARVGVTTAVPLDPARAERLREALQRWLGGRVVLEQQTDPDIIGGAVVQIGDRAIDGSLRGRLERIRASLADG